MKLPLSRDPKMRKMKKTISEAEDEIRNLKMMLSKYHTLPVSTPESSPTSSIGSISTVYSPSRTSFGSKSLTRTPSRFPRVHANQEGVSEMRSPTTAAMVLGLAGGRPRQGTLRRCRGINKEESRQPG